MGLNIDRVPLLAVIVTVGVPRANDLLAIKTMLFVSASVEFPENNKLFQIVIAFCLG